MSEAEQGSDEWLQERLGRVTASRVSDIIGKTKSGYSASRDNYMAQLLIERLTNAPVAGFQSASMRRGIELEPAARQAYSFLTRQSVAEVGFIQHPRIAMSGASPDGLVGEQGLVEIKCPEAAAHVETLLGASIPAKYMAQMQWQMTTTDRAWCDYVSFHPDFPAGMDAFIVRIGRDNGFIANTEGEVRKFLGELDAKLAELQARYGQVEAA